METFLMKALQLIVALMILVTIHEFGHYIFARIFGIKVNRFYLFFNPWFSLLKWYPSEGKLEVIGWTEKVKTGTADDEYKEEPRAWLTFKVGKPRPTVTKKGRPSWAATMYGLGWLPLGGYCDIAGMVDETKSAKDLGSEAQPWEFRSKAAYKRFLVMVAGVLFNFILAILIYAGIAWHWGDRNIPYQAATEGMDFAQPLLDAGFKTGDILLTINGEKADSKNGSQLWDMVQPGAKVEVLRNHTDKVDIIIPDNTLDEVAQLKSGIVGLRIPAIVEQLQGGMPAAKAELKIGDRILKVGNDTTPALTEFFPALAANAGHEVPILIDRGGKEIEKTITPDENGKIGIMLRPVSGIYPYEEVKYGLLASLPRGWELGTNQLTTYVSSLKLLFTKTGAQSVGGFGTLGNLFPERWDWYSFWEITAFLSVILAFMNIIPIPGLDGGHVLFLLWEIVTRRKPSDKFLEYANTVGFAFLLLLLVYANGADLFRALQ
ncbi:MAG: RIP metalloprotease RseP [Bacteroidales bacterium]|nr:RIP metalloprotease RseP [Bacteroidales bacterium]